MKLICTIQQGNLTVADGSALSHRLYFDFVTRIGIDGKDGITPHVGPDGNWWIGTQNTNIPAEGLRSFQTYHNFPNIGNPNMLYLDMQASKLYRWDDEHLTYCVIGKHYDEIDIIDGGNAEKPIIMANVTLKAKLVLRNDTESNWIKANPVLIKGEMGYCTDKQYLKIGDGTKVFTMLPKNTLGKVILFDDPPTDEDAKKWEPGTIFMHIMTTPPTLYMVTWSDDLERVLQQIVTVESFDALGVMQQDKYAKSAGAGPDTGYVDKALMADKLKTARTIALTGGVGGSASFDGSGNISIATTLSITENDVPSLPLYKIRDAGTAASRNVGTTAGQVPILDASGKLNTSVLPQLAIVDVVEAASDAEMLAKTVQKGDICLRSDAPAGAFILAGNDPKELANWKRIPVPANAVLSVNGKVGVITLTTDDIAEGSRLYFTPARLTSYLQDANNTFIMDGGNA